MCIGPFADIGRAARMVAGSETKDEDVLNQKCERLFELLALSVFEQPCHEEEYGQVLANKRLRHTGI